MTYVDKPSNYQDMEDFYAELWRRKPWVFEKRGGFTEKGYPVTRPLYGDELNAEVEKSARLCGMSLPVPVWDNDPF